METLGNFTFPGKCLCAGDTGRFPNAIYGAHCKADRDSGE